MIYDLMEGRVEAGLFGLLCLGWAVGGWLLATHLFRLHRGERLLAGVGTGWLLYVAAANLLAHWLPPTPAFWLASALVLVAGVAAAWRSAVRPWLDWRDRSGWLQLAAVLVLTMLFYSMLRGLAIFDDYVHLPLVSILAAGDVPPHFYVDPSVYFTYHYALDLFAAVAVRIGRFYPWSAWDLARALAIALTLGLGWLFVRRLVRSSLAAALGAFLIAFGGGARWLLLFLPLSLLNRISGSITLINTGADTAGDLIKALTGPWIIEGGGPLPFPFAYHNGIFVPAFFILGSSGCFPFVVILLMLLLTTRAVVSPAAAVVMGVIFATLALSAEHMFIPLWGGLALALLIYLARNRLRPSGLFRARFWQWAGVLGLGGLLAAFQGGYLTEAGRSLFSNLQGAAAPQSNNFYLFTVRWPPALPSAHFGDLSILNPRQLAALLAELGPVLLLAPLVAWFTWRCIRRDDWLKAGLGFASLVSFIFPIFFQYGIDRQSNRLTASALWIWLLLGFPLLALAYRRGRLALRVLLGMGYTITAFGGIVILAVMMIAIPAPQNSYFISTEDMVMTRRYWDRLEPGAQVLDNFPERAVTIFGRASRARPHIYDAFPDYQALAANPDPVAAAQAGYSYIYMTNQWWSGLTLDQKSAFDNPCVHMIVTGEKDFDRLRWLFDIRGCKP